MSFISYLNSQKRDKKNAMWQKRADRHQEKIDQLSAISSSNADVMEILNRRINAAQGAQNFANNNKTKNNNKFDYTGQHLASLNNTDSRFNQAYRENMIDYLEKEDRSVIESFLDAYKDAKNDTDREYLIKGALGLDLV